MRVVAVPYPSDFMQELAEWTAKMLDASEATAKEIGVSPAAIVAQAALETGWGKSAIGNNVFGVKADPSWKGGRQCVTTREWDPVERTYVTERDYFRDYASLADGIVDHFNFLRDNSRYSNVFNTGSDRAYFTALAADGYATDPRYADKLMDVLTSVENIERHLTVQEGT